MTITGGIPGNIDVGIRNKGHQKKPLAVTNTGHLKNVICLDTFGCYNGLFREICHHCQHGTSMDAARHEVFPFITYDAQKNVNIPLFLPQEMADSLAIQVARDMHSDDQKLADLSRVVFNADGTISSIEQPILDYKEVSYTFPTLQDFALLYMYMQDNAKAADTYTGKANVMYTIRNVSVWPVVFFMLVHKNVMEMQIDLNARNNKYDFGVLASMNAGTYENPDKGRTVGNIRLSSADSGRGNVDMSQGRGQSTQSQAPEGIRERNPAAHPEVPGADNSWPTHA